MSANDSKKTSASTGAKPDVDRVTGVQLAQGIGHQPAKGFWADAWEQVLRSPRAVAAICWISLVAAFAVLSPLIASGHPIYAAYAESTNASASPLLFYLSATDVLLLLGTAAGLAIMFLPGKASRKHRFGVVAQGVLVGALALIIAAMVRGSGLGQWLVGQFGGTTSGRLVPFFGSGSGATLLVGLLCGLAAGAVSLVVPFVRTLGRRIGVVAIVAVVAGGVMGLKWVEPLERFDYTQRERAGQITSSIYTIVPFSPQQRDTKWFYEKPGTTVAEAENRDPIEGERNPSFILGTDETGQDVLSQMLHACRLSISIGLVSTSIAVIIGVTLGAIMGYFGGWVDMLLYRIVEVFMAIPVLFLLIVAAGVLPRNTYVMMIIIGCVSWTGAARFTRAEFMKLRNQDFVQAGKALGLPLRSVLFRHMLPNGVTPVLVDASFAIAVAILIEAILSFLGLGPSDQSSWGKLLQDATGESGQYRWWLAIFPGGAIFLTVLSYNLLGETMRDAIDPKLKKARV